MSPEFAEAVFFVSSNFPAKWDTICPLVMGLLAIFFLPGGFGL